MTLTVTDWGQKKTSMALRARRILKMARFQIIGRRIVQVIALNARTDFGSSAPKSSTKGSRLAKVET